jgi:hypothetical protein
MTGCIKGTVGKVEVITFLEEIIPLPMLFHLYVDLGL